MGIFVRKVTKKNFEMRTQWVLLVFRQIVELVENCLPQRVFLVNYEDILFR